MKRKPLVIAIAAVSGGGKTTITDQLITRLDNSKAMYFDDYEFDECPDDICEWVERGADYNEWVLTPLINDLKSLHNQSLDYIFLDYPFAYLKREIGEYIDLAVYIDTPLDVALARRILRDFSNNPIENVRNDLRHYLSNGRSAYLEMETVKANSDLVIDGSLSKSATTDRIVKEIV